VDNVSLRTVSKDEQRQKGIAKQYSLQTILTENPHDTHCSYHRPDGPPDNIAARTDLYGEAENSPPSSTEFPRNEADLRGVILSDQ